MPSQPTGHRRPLPTSAAWLVPLALSASLLGCSESSSKSSTGDPGVELLSGFEPLTPEEGGIAMYTPIIEGVEPGADVTYCTYTSTITTEDLFVHLVEGVQSRFGHHVIVFYTSIPEKKRTEECFGQDMTKFHQLLGGTGGEGAFFWKPPDNVGTVIPKGSQFVVQTHWINTDADPADVQAMAVTVPGTTSADRIEAGSVAVVNTTFNIPPKGPYTTTTECTFDREQKLMMTLGHEHEWGTHVHAEVLRGSGTTDQLFDRPFVTSDVFNPPVQDYGIEKPLVFAAGDRVKMTCTWNNDTTEALQFPREMCVFFGYSLSNDDAHCVDGEWSHSGDPQPDAGAWTPPECVDVGAPGNEFGVGEYCTPKGGECADNGSGNATFCAADFGGFKSCTMPCIDASKCGANAVCVGDSPTATTKGCIPLSCAPSWAVDGGAP